MADNRDRGGRGGRGGFQPPVRGGGRGGGQQQAPQRGGHPPALQRGGHGQPGPVRGGLPQNVPQHPPQGLAPMQQAPARGPVPVQPHVQPPLQPPVQAPVQAVPQLAVPLQGAWLRGPLQQQIAPAQQLAPMQQQAPRGQGVPEPQQVQPPVVQGLVPQGGPLGGQAPQQPAQVLAPMQAPPRAPAPRTYPRGFATEREFRDATRGLAEQARDGEVFVSGSSVTGHSYRNPHIPFHVASYRRRDAQRAASTWALHRAGWQPAGEVDRRGFPERGTRLGEAERRGRNNNRQHPIGVRVYDADSAADAVPDREVIVRPHTPERERRRPPDLDPPRGGGRGGRGGGRGGSHGSF